MTTAQTSSLQATRFSPVTRVLAALGACVLIGAGTAVSASAESSPAPLVGTSAQGAIADEYLVVLKDRAQLIADGVRPGSSSISKSAQVKAAVARGKKLGATVQNQFSHALQGYSAQLSTGELAEVRADPTVAYVQANQRYHTTASQPNPVWGLDRIDQRSLPLSASYFYNGTGTGVTAYVVDTGIRGTHLDFTTDASGNTVPSRVSGGVSEIGGTTNDCIGHGTHVAGTIGGTYYGVAKKVSLVPIRVLDCNGVSTSETVAAGLDWIVANHDDGQPAVANLSLTNEGGADPVVEEAVQRMIADGVTTVIAAGNGDADGNGTSACSVSPSNVREAITVGSTTKTDNRSTFSNYGSCVDLYAPGSDIESDWYTGDDQVAVISGTSMAAPHVSGAAVLYLQRHPSATPAQVQAAIVAAATPDKVTNVSSKWPRRLLFAVPKVDPPPATTTPSEIPPGAALLQGGQLCSPNTLYCLTQQASDANLVLYKPGGRALWASGKPAAWTKMEPSGNLVSYNVYNKAVWSSQTSGVGASTLKVTDKGNLVILNNATSQVEWTSNTAQKTAPKQAASSASILNAGEAIYRNGVRLASPTAKFQLILRSTGDLVIWKTGVGQVWHTGAKDDDWLTVTSTGNLVLYRSDGKVAWSSNTAGLGASRLILRDSGDLVLARFSDNKIIWHSGTAGA